MSRIIADFHIHSPYSRAVSRDINLPALDKWAQKKGIMVVGTGDFTHPEWFKHLKEKLEPAEPGLYKIKGGESSIRFVVTTEISSIYSHGGKVRRVHNLIFTPSLEVAEKISQSLSQRGAKLSRDGRPIVGISSQDLLKITLDISSDCLFVPAHAWTPWFAVFGSKSGYDSLEECFGDEAKYIYAIETGLSSDPEMNWRLSGLDKITLLSNSDPHSLRRLGREANVFEIDREKLSYYELLRIIKEKDAGKFLFTIEYYPEEGRYHYDGDRLHSVCLSPQESAKLKQQCPKCGRPLTVGVLSRVQELADRPEGYVPTKAIPGKHLVPLDEIIAETIGVKTVTSRSVVSLYDKMVSQYPGGELGILLDASLPQIAYFSSEIMAEAINRVRVGKLDISPGYDGVYGTVKIFSDKERLAFADKNQKQKALF